VNLGNVSFALVLEFFVGAVVGDEHLVCLLERRVEAVLAPHDAFVHPDVELVTVLVWRLHVQDLLPDVLGVVVAWKRVNAPLSRCYLSFQGFQQIVG
jgi:hypothetical protein